MQPSLTDWQANDQQHHDCAVPEDEPDLQMQKSPGQPTLQLKSLGQGLKEDDTGETGQLVLLEAELCQRMGFRMNGGPANRYRNGRLSVLGDVWHDNHNSVEAVFSFQTGGFVTFSTLARGESSKIGIAARSAGNYMLISLSGREITQLADNLFLHGVLDLWFEQQVKLRLCGEAYLVRYITDFGICFQHEEYADRVQLALGNQLHISEVTLESSKTKPVKFGRIAQWEGCATNKHVEPSFFVGFTQYYTRNREVNCKIGRKAEKPRLRHTLAALRELKRDIRRWSLKDHVCLLNQWLRNHFPSLLSKLDRIRGTDCGFPRVI